MTIAYEKPLYGFRFVEIQFNDTLQSIAARELGDAGRWSELIAYNGLVPPFVTSTPSEAGPGVLLAGAMIRLPAPVPVVETTTDPDRVFERDALLDEKTGGLLTKDGDFAVADGRTNLRQALRHRVLTERGDLSFHPQYGSLHRRLIGVGNGPTVGLLAAEYVKSAMRADPRVRQVNKASAEVVGDTIRVSVEVQPIAGRTIQLDADL